MVERRRCENGMINDNVGNVGIMVHAFLFAEIIIFERIAMI
jgi:hypothetical protein